MCMPQWQKEYRSAHSISTMLSWIKFRYMLPAVESHDYEGGPSRRGAAGKLLLLWDCACGNLGVPFTTAAAVADAGGLEGCVCGMDAD